MEPIVIRYREWWFFDLLSIFPMGLGILGAVRGLPNWQSVILIAIGIVCIVIFSRQALSEDILSADGITMKRPGKTVLIPWTDVIQVGVAATGGMPKHNMLLLTFRGGKPCGVRCVPLLWELRNLRTGTALACREDAEAYVRRFYGPLDFDKRRPGG